SAIFGDSFFAPQNTLFQIQVDATGTITASENIDLVSIYQNPWTPNIPIERLPQFMAGLQRTGHTRLFVDTQPLVNGYTIQEQSAREYYATLIQLARREGIQVYATQGNPAWITPAGISTAQTYLYTLGNTAVDFDGYVLNIQADRLPQWSQLSETERPLFAAHYSDVIAQFEETIRSFSGHNRTIFSTIPLAIHSTEGYTPNTALSDILIITETTADDIVARIAEYNPTQPFHVQIETSLLDQAQTTFALRENQMPSVLEDVAQQLRQHPQYGTLFSGFVINHDTGEDILHVMEHGTGRDAGDRMRDGLRTDSDIPIMLTQNLYNMVVFGSSPEVVQTGEETPSSWEVIQAQLRSRLQGTLRGITGAANVDHMVNSLIETVNRDRFTILPEAIPFGAEFGTGLAASTFIWGQQYSEMAAINAVTIEGLNEDGIVVEEWNDILNAPFPIIIGQNSAITNLRFSVNIESGAQQNQTFPGYLVLLTHHPQNGGIVTETSSDQFNLPAGDSTTIEFTVPVSAEGINNFGFMLMNGQKYSDREVVVDRVGIGHRYGIIADWIQSHADEYPIYYSDAVTQSSELEINRLGLWSGMIDSRVVVNTFELEHFDIAQPQTQQTIELLAESGFENLFLMEHNLWK
ncbi:MAG: hypothetical protein H7A34_03860, partial [bacterium]|nr:hypothetical protein [bacterium]